MRCAGAVLTRSRGNQGACSQLGHQGGERLSGLTVTNVAIIEQQVVGEMDRIHTLIAWDRRRAPLRRHGRRKRSFSQLSRARLGKSQDERGQLRS